MPCYELKERVYSNSPSAVYFNDPSEDNSFDAVVAPATFHPLALLQPCARASGFLLPDARRRRRYDREKRRYLGQGLPQMTIEMRAWRMSLLLVLTLPAAACIPPMPGAATTSAMCNPGFPHGMQGTLPTKTNVFATYRTTGSPNEIAASNILASLLSQQAAANPAGPQFVYPEGTPYELYVTIDMFAQGDDGAGHPQAYWGRVRVQDQRGLWLFELTTSAYEQDEIKQIWFDGAREAYARVANGWTCGQ